jgi:hypothetical protein
VQDEIRAYKTGATSDKNWPHSDLQELGTVIAILIRAKKHEKHRSFTIFYRPCFL